MSQDARVRVHVVYGAAIDADRGEQACVIADAVRVRDYATVIEEDGPAGVAAFDAAVEVVPFVCPADRRIGSMGFVQIGNRLVQREFS